MSDVNPKQARSDAKADAAAAKARAKAMRPWFKRKRVILPLVLLVVIGIAAVSSGGSDDKKTAASSGTKSVQSSGSNPAEADVVIDSCSRDDAGFSVAHLSITNHSSKQSNYLISLNYEDSSGTKLAEAGAASNNIDPGQTAKEDATFLKSDLSGGTCKIKSVSRYASAG